MKITLTAADLLHIFKKHPSASSEDSSDLHAQLIAWHEKSLSNWIEDDKEDAIKAILNGMPNLMNMTIEELLQEVCEQDSGQRFAFNLVSSDSYADDALNLVLKTT